MSCYAGLICFCSMNHVLEISIFVELAGIQTTGVQDWNPDMSTNSSTNTDVIVIQTGSSIQCWSSIDYSETSYIAAALHTTLTMATTAPSVDDILKEFPNTIIPCINVEPAYQ
eukprot:5567852-Ditylum_brightwellii.AAC.3